MTQMPPLHDVSSSTILISIMSLNVTIDTRSLISSSTNNGECNLGHHLHKIK